MSECGDVLLAGFMSDHVDARPGPGLLMLLHRVQVSAIRVLEGLPGAFMSGQVILLAVMLGASEMGVGGKVAVLGSDLL
jgi:hypothetical protein